MPETETPDTSAAQAARDTGPAKCTVTMHTEAAE